MESVSDNPAHSGDPGSASRWAASALPADAVPDGAIAATCGRVRLLATALQPGRAARQARAVLAGMLRGAGLDEAAVFDATLAVGELAGNAERHARPPYELRAFLVAGVPVWCEVIDGDPDLTAVTAALRRPLAGDDEVLREGGRGLPLVRRLAEGHCRAYPATPSCTGTPGKAVGFALPTPSGVRHGGPPYPVPQARLS